MRNSLGTTEAICYTLLNTIKHSLEELTETEKEKLKLSFEKQNLPQYNRQFLSTIRKKP